MVARHADGEPLRAQLAITADCFLSRREVRVLSGPIWRDFAVNAEAALWVEVHSREHSHSDAGILYPPVHTKKGAGVRPCRH